MLEKSAIHSEAPLLPYQLRCTAAAVLRYGAFQAIRNSLSQLGHKSQCRLTSPSSGIACCAANVAQLGNIISKELYLSISDKFSNFCTALRMSDTTVSNIRYRAKQITKRVNSDFRGIDSDTRYSLFVGSYGRGTDIHVSDIDMIVELPYSEYEKYDKYSGNGQSALIQAVKNSIKKTYSTTHVSGDGQVVKLNFDDGVCYEIVPGFINKDGSSYTYPDSNNGGSWKVTKPREEISEISSANNLWNKNLKRLCRMARAWKGKWDVPMGGLLIDTLAYNFLKQWEYKDKSYIYYDWMTRDFFEYLKNRDPNKNYWLAPGSSQYVRRKGAFEHKALRCYNIAKEALQYEANEMPYLANQKWREIYGTKFPF